MSAAWKRALLAALAAVAGGAALVTTYSGSVEVAADAGAIDHALVRWGDAGAPAGLRCATATARLAPGALALPAGGYTLLSLATPDDDAGMPPGLPELLDVQEVPCAAPGGSVEAWQGGAAQWACACGVGCTELFDGGSRSWAAGGGNTLRSWTAPDAGACVRRPCVELAGFPAEPPECR